MVWCNTTIFLVRFSSKVWEKYKVRFLNTYVYRGKPGKLLIKMFGVSPYPLLIKCREKSIEKKVSRTKVVTFPWYPTIPSNCRIMSFFHGLTVNGARKKEIISLLVSYGKYNVRFFYSSFFLWRVKV